MVQHYITIPNIITVYTHTHTQTDTDIDTKHIGFEKLVSDWLEMLSLNKSISYWTEFEWKEVICE